MTALQKLKADTNRYLKLLNEIGTYKLWELLFVVDYWAVVFFRLQEFAGESPAGIRYMLKILIWFLKPLIEGLSGARIRSGASIGPGLVVFNSFGVLIATDTKIGRDCTIYSGVFVAHKGNDNGSSVPTIGDNVILMSGCKVLGGVTIGNCSVIGANSVVIADVPSTTIAVGVPSSRHKVMA